eukprot:4623935-Alexandrium_andersonii.AAC.1
MFDDVEDALNCRPDLGVFEISGSCSELPEVHGTCQLGMVVAMHRRRQRCVGLPAIARGQGS